MSDDLPDPEEEDVCVEIFQTELRVPLTIQTCKYFISYFASVVIMYCCLTSLAYFFLVRNIFIYFLNPIRIISKVI